MLNLSTTHKSHTIAIRVLACALLVCPAITQSKLSAQSSRNNVTQFSPLLSGKRIESQLRGGQSNVHTINLRQGEYLHVIVEQQGINVVAALFDPSGAKLVKVNFFGGVGPEPISHVAWSAGVYRLEVSAYQGQTGAGRYGLTILVKPEAAPQEQLRMAAERSLVTAQEFSDVNDLKRALEASQQSLVQWEQLGDNYWHSYTLNTIADLYERLGERTKAAENAKHALVINRGTGDPLIEAIVLFTLARLGSTLEERRTYLNQALLRFKKVGHREAVGETLMEVGRTFFEGGNDGKAIEYDRSVLAMAQSSGYTRLQANVVSDIAIVYSHLNQSRKALQYYKQALPLWRAANDRPGEAIVLNNIGHEYLLMGRYQTAIGFHKLALAIHEDLKSDTGTSASINYLAESYLSLGNKKKALELLQKSLQLERARGDQNAEADKLGRIGNIHESLGDYQEELKYKLPALSLLRALGNRQAEAETLAQISEAYRELQKVELALEYDQQALVLWHSFNNPEREASTLRSIAGEYFVLNQKRRALEPLIQALSLYQSLKDHGNAGIAQTMIGLDYYLLGERDKSWKNFSDALPLLRYPDVTQAQAEELINLPIMLMLFEDYAGALKYYRQVVAASGGPTRRRLKAIALADIGKIYTLSEDKTLALKSLQEALSLYRAIGNRAGEAAMLNEIGKVYLGWRDDSSSPEPSATACSASVFTPEQEQGVSQKMKAPLQELHENVLRANEFFQRALSLYTNPQDRAGEGETLVNIGTVQQMLGNDQEAFDDFRQALVLVKGSPNPSREVGALYRLMDVCTDLSNPELAILFGKQAINHLQEIRSTMKLMDKSLEHAFVHLTTDVYRELASLLVKEGRLLEAEQVLEMLKEEEFFRFVRRDDQVARELLTRTNLSPAEKEALELYDEIAEKIVALGDEYGRLEAKRRGLPPRQAASIVKRQEQINKDLTAARKTLSLFLDTLKEKFGIQDKRIAEVEEGLQAEVKSWNEPRTVVVSTIVGKDSFSMVLTTADTQVPFIVRNIDGEAFTEARLNELIAEFREATKDPAEDPRPAGQKLYDVLVKPLEKDLQVINADTIVWSLDANLRYVPMAALYDSQQGYLAERYASVIITLASHNNFDSTSADNIKWKALGLGVSKSVAGFPPLVNVQAELRAIVREADQHERTGLLEGHRLLDEQFTLETFKLHLGHYNVIHAATHFSFRSGTRDEALESFLLLGSGEKLTLAQVKDGGAMFSGVELLVLSACETAAGGRGADGREVEGFGVLAQKAGARTVMATLWPVADPSTRELMVRFYELHGSTPHISKAEALRLAQMSLLRADGTQPVELRTTLAGRFGTNGRKSNSSFPPKGFAHPYYWAPFLLIGNWK